jgi:hypothetical protein
VSIRIVDGKKIFKCCIHFFFLVLTGVFACNSQIPQAILQPASNSDKYTLLLNFLNIASVFRETLRGRGLFHVTGTCKHLCYIF